MKKKFRLLSALLTLTLGTVMVFSACGKNSPNEHEHIWNDGVETTAATCYSLGKMTYACTVKGCKETMTEPIAMLDHTWDDGEITEEPTCKTTGVKTYTCKVEGCGQTKPETVDKLLHSWDDGKITKIPDLFAKGEFTYTCGECGETRTDILEAHADFAEQYYTSLPATVNWRYGYAQDFDSDTNDFTFVQIMQTDEVQPAVWKADGVEIERGRVKSENNAVIAYSFTRELDVDVSISFEGDEENTLLNACLVLVDKDGIVKAVENDLADGKDWSYKCENALEIAEGDVLYLVFDNNGSGSPSGNVKFTIKVPCLHVWDDGEEIKQATCTEKGEIKYSCVLCGASRTEETDMVDHDWDEGKVTKEPSYDEKGTKTYTCNECGETKEEDIPKLVEEHIIADFASDFTLTEQGKWKYGYATNFDYDNNTFTFTELTITNTDNGAWTNNSGIEIKADWMCTETDGADTAVRYISEVEGEIKISIAFNGSADETRIAARLLIAGASGTICEFISAGQSSRAWTFEYTATVAEGDAITLIFFREGGGYNHGSFSMKITGDQEVPEKHEHDYGEWIEEVPATCSKTGTLGHYKCDECEKYFDVNHNEIKDLTIEIDPDAHKWGEWGTVNEATCVDGGLEQRVCEHNPADHIDSKTTPNLGHDVDETAIIITDYPTFEKEGSFTTGKCNRCEDYEGGTHTLPKLDDEKYVVTDNTADCENDGEGVYAITVDGIEVPPFHAETRATGHDYSEEWEHDGDAHWHVCLNCGEEEPESRAEHNWDEVVIKPTLTKAGKKTYTCTDECGETKEESIEMLSSVSFEQDFTTNPDDKHNWRYGYTDNFNFDENTFTFNPISAADDKWTDNDGIEIKADWIRNESGGRNAVVQFISNVEGKIRIFITFTGEKDKDDDNENVTHVAARLHIAKSDGSKVCEFIGAGAQNKDWTYGYVIEVKEGDVISLLLFNEGGEGYYKGHFSMTVTMAPEGKIPAQKLADFQQDFTAEEGGSWKYGYATDYDWGNNNFTFNELSSNGNDAWNGAAGVEIKRDWILAEGNTTVGYKVPSGKTKLDVYISFIGTSAGETRIAVRLLVVGSDGVTKHADYIADGKDYSSWSVNRTVDVAEGDTVYVILFREANAWAQGVLQVIIGDVAEEQAQITDEYADKRIYE